MKAFLFALIFSASLYAAASTAASAHEKVIGLYSLDGASGYAPNGGVITDRHGTVFGTTSIGGNGPCDGGAGCGTVYALSPPSAGGKSWTLNVVYNFQNNGDGWAPDAQLTLGPNGSLYGYPAAGSYGTVFQLLPPARGLAAWTYNILYIFSGGADGNLLSVAAPLLRHGKSLYGIASGGSNACGEAGCGSVFRLDPPKGGTGNWTWKSLYEFTGGATGGEPNWISGPDANGSFYVSTTLRNGTVVQISPPAGKGAWSANLLTKFSGGDDGRHPTSLVLAPYGTLYGIASTKKGGLAFELVNSGSGWTRTNIANVAHQKYGPDSLAAGTDGSLIGTIGGDPDFFPGAVFELTNNAGNWTYTELCTFGDGPDRNPINVVTGKGDNLFGVLNGGDSGSGTLFEMLNGGASGNGPPLEER